MLRREFVETGVAICSLPFLPTFFSFSDTSKFEIIEFTDKDSFVFSSFGKINIRYSCVNRNICNFSFIGHKYQHVFPLLKSNYCYYNKIIKHNDVCDAWHKVFRYSDILNYSSITLDTFVKNNHFTRNIVLFNKERQILGVSSCFNYLKDSYIWVDYHEKVKSRF